LSLNEGLFVAEFIINFQTDALTTLSDDDTLTHTYSWSTSFGLLNQPGLLKLFPEKCVPVPIYLSLSIRAKPREQTIQVAKAALRQEIWAKQSL